MTPQHPSNQVSDAELREMVRASIARVTGSAAAAPMPGGHPSFVQLALATGGDADGACLIEPSVRCNHCGYCLSYGH